MLYGVARANISCDEIPCMKYKGKNILPAIFSLLNYYVFGKPYIPVAVTVKKMVSDPLMAYQHGLLLLHLLILTESCCM